MKKSVLRKAVKSYNVYLKRNQRYVQKGDRFPNVRENINKRVNAIQALLPDIREGF